MKQQSGAILYAVTAVLIWSTVASAFKLTLSHLEPAQMLLLSTMVSSTALLTVIVFQGKLKRLRGYDTRLLIRCGLLGLLNPFIYYMVLFEAYSRLPAQEAQPLNYTWPIALMILSYIFLKQRIGVRQVAGIILGFAGVLVITTHGEISTPGSLSGVCLGLLSALIWASFWTINLRDEQDDVIRLYLAFTFSLPIIFFVVILSSGFESINVRGAAGSIYIGLFEMGLTFLIWNKALKLSRTTTAVSRFIYLVPLISLLPIHLLVGEDIKITSMIGLILIILGIVMGRERRDRTSSPDGPDRVQHGPR